MSLILQLSHNGESKLMAKPLTWQTDGWQSTRVTVRACLYDDSTGVPIVPSAVSSIAYTVKESVGPSAGTTTGSGSLSPVSSYLNSSLSVVGWTYDSTGWNFSASLPASCFPDAGDYVVDFVFTLTDGTTFPVKLYHHVRSRG